MLVRANRLVKYSGGSSGRAGGSPSVFRGLWQRSDRETAHGKTQTQVGIPILFSFPAVNVVFPWGGSPSGDCKAAKNSRVSAVRLVSLKFDQWMDSGVVSGEW